jgi:AcrR family transcriptional regulator
VPRSGRRPGTSGSREKILAAARAHFAKSGYDGATMRAIAASAHVDPALVTHFFGSKERLFVEALEFPDPSVFVPKLLAPGRDGLGERLAAFFLEVWDSTEGRPLLGVMRSMVANERAAEMMREFVSRAVLGRIAAALEVDRPKLRAALSGSQLIGLAFLRHVIRLEPIASASREELVRLVGPTLQRYLTAPLTPKATARRRRGSATRN